MSTEMADFVDEWRGKWGLSTKWAVFVDGWEEMGGDGRRWEEMGRHGEMVRTNREAVARDLRRDGGGINR